LKRPFYIAGPCVIENETITLKTAEHIVAVAERLGVDVVFKSSYLKANRLSSESYSGPGLKEGLRVLAKVKSETGLPVLTDVHETAEVESVALVADWLQIPAFLCRQTALVEAAAKTGRAVNIKKGQFIAPEDMGPIAAKAVAVGNDRIHLTERGTTFGYRDLVVDFRSLVTMKRLGYRVIFDATHSTQSPGGAGGLSGGRIEFALPLARAAVAVGVDGLFAEVHPDPSSALCDRDCQLHIDDFENFVVRTLEVAGASL
jgi:2-dehydro-3-deoxyphosphooctonate aldolase (KDO 8-P synthase)